jgi:hypothetical protein
MAPTRSTLMRRSGGALLAVMLVGCATTNAPRVAPPPEPRADSGVEDRNATAAMVVGSTFQNMQRLSQSPPAEQAEILSAARTAFEHAPQGSLQLRYAMLLTAPGQPGQNLPLAQTLLRQLAAQPDTLLPIERAVTVIELSQLESELGLQSENERLQSDAERSDREHILATQHRLQAEVDENTRLRKQLDDAQVKLDAIANIERNLTSRKTPGEARPQ